MLPCWQWDRWCQYFIIGVQHWCWVGGREFNTPGVGRQRSPKVNDWYCYKSIVYVLLNYDSDKMGYFVCGSCDFQLFWRYFFYCKPIFPSKYVCLLPLCISWRTFIILSKNKTIHVYTFTFTKKKKKETGEKWQHPKKEEEIKK